MSCHDLSTLSVVRRDVSCNPRPEFRMSEPEETLQKPAAQEEVDEPGG